MTDAATPMPQPPLGGFEVAVTAIPIGVRCRSCGRMHLPARLWPLAIETRSGGEAQVELRCVRCNASGSLLLDTENPGHRALLAVWEGQAPGHGDAKEPA